MGDDFDEGEGGDHWSEENVWKGHVVMPDVAKFDAKAFKVSYHYRIRDLKG